MNDFRKEILRKLIHFSGLVYIPAYIYFGRELVLWGTILALTLSVVFEYFRITRGLFSSIVREYEKKNIGAYVYFSLSILIVTLLFPKDACFVAVSVSLIGDGLAGIVRRSPLGGGASIVMVLAPMMFITFFSLALLPQSLVACISGAAIERVKKVGKYYLQDNLTVPVVAAMAYEITKYIIS